MVVEFDPEALQQLARLFASESADLEIALVERIDVLVQMAGIEGVPGVQLGNDGQVGEPIGLQRFVEIARRVCRHVTAGIGDGYQFGFAPDVGLGCSQFLRLLCVALGKTDHGVGGDGHGP